MLKNLFLFVFLSIGTDGFFFTKNFTEVLFSEKPKNFNEIPVAAQKILKTYPNIVVDYQDNYLIFADGTKLLFDDKKNKSPQQRLENADIEDQFFYVYPKSTIERSQLVDAGRIRNEDFFKKVYGASAAQVQKNLVQIVWCPRLVNQKISVTKINGVAIALQKISDELDQHAQLKPYLSNIGGTFNWRKISGTNRLSNHAFGITIDINVAHAHYWQWLCACTSETAAVRDKYQNKIPMLIVEIFEKNGFIWGGKWEHFDTMHFEYRPELLLD